MEKILLECKYHGICNHYVTKTKRKLCVNCNIERVSNKRVELKKKAVNYLGGKCKICGYSKYIGALEFHHKDPSKKDFGIAAGGKIRKWDFLKEELDKCILLCSNCHKEVHAKITLPDPLIGKRASC